MSYSIHYEPEFNRKYKVPSIKKMNYKLIIAISCAIIIALVWLINPLRYAVLDFLLPGNGAVTRKAAGEMFDQLKNGQPFKEAFTGFCIEILQNA